MRAQLHEPLTHAGLHGPQGDAEPVGDLRLRKPFIVAQLDDGLLVGAQRGKPLAHERLVFGSDGGVQRVGQVLVVGEGVVGAIVDA
jgi:hypothetical protein